MYFINCLYLLCEKVLVIESLMTPTNTVKYIDTNIQFNISNLL